MAEPTHSLTEWIETIVRTNFEIFDNHCERVSMAKIAQMVNVLEAMTLTGKERMLLTPSYHAFEMYSVHRNATKMPCNVQSEHY